MRVLARLRAVDWRLLIWMFLPQGSVWMLWFAVAFSGANLIFPPVLLDGTLWGIAIRAAHVIALAGCAWVCGQSQAQNWWLRMYREQAEALETLRHQLFHRVPALAWGEPVEDRVPEPPLLAAHRGRVTVLLTLPGVGEGREAALEETLRTAVLRAVRDYGIAVASSASVWVATEPETEEGGADVSL